MRAVFCFALLLAGVRADTLQLLDGRVIQGIFITGDRGGIRFRPYNSRHSHLYPMTRVASVSFGDGTKSASVEAEGAMPTATALAVDTATTPATAVTSSMPAATPNLQAQGNFIPAGTRLAVRISSAIDLDASHIGDSIPVTLAHAIVVNGNTVAPAGSSAAMQVVGVAGGNRLTDQGDVTLQLTSITTSDGRQYNVSTGDVRVTGGPHGANSADVYAGPSPGSIVPGTVAAGKPFLVGQRIQVEANAELTFTLQQDVDLV